MPQLFLLLCCLAVGLSPTISADLDFNPKLPIKTVAHLYAKDSPFQFDHDIQVTPKGTLFIEPGVVVRFSAGFGLICNGTLKAGGTEKAHIKFTRLLNTSIGAHVDWDRTMRLVDGVNTHDGRVQIFYRDRWRDVCTNYKNWTRSDVRFACRQMGFRDGNFTFHYTQQPMWNMSRWWFGHNDSAQMVFDNPSCLNGDTNVLNCAGRVNISLNVGACNLQPLAGLKCFGFREDIFYAIGYWKGISFFNSTFMLQKTPELRRLLNESKSILEYVDIEFAGVDHTGRPHSALTASPYAPVLRNITINYSAMDALNLTDIDNTAIVAGASFSYNRGSGIFGAMREGRLVITDSNFTDNAGHGIWLDVINNNRRKTPNAVDFCSSPSLYQNQFYPLAAVGTPKASPPCSQYFYTDKHLMFMVSFSEVFVDPEADGWLDFYAGRAGLERIVQTIYLSNGTMPQSVVIASSVMRIDFRWIRAPQCHFIDDCIRFIAQIATGPAPYPYPEMSVDRSLLQRNMGSGVYIRDMRGQVVLTDNHIENNGYSGLRVIYGAGDVILNRTNLVSNLGGGANISYSGGRQVFDRCKIHRNDERGIYLQFYKYNQSRVEVNQTLEVFRSEILNTSGMGMFFGNYCRNALFMVNNSRIEGNDYGGVSVEACRHPIDRRLQNYTLYHNYIGKNRDFAIQMVPLVNAIGKILDNDIEHHTRGALIIDNSDDRQLMREFFSLPVNYSVEQNRFFNNSGPFAVFARLVQGSPIQRVSFVLNDLRKNDIRLPPGYAVTRTHTPAVTVLSSSNILFYQNALFNPKSTYELSTLLRLSAATINASLNWWGKNDHKYIYERIIDHARRYDLATIEYYPALSDSRLFLEYTTSYLPKFLPDFIRGDRLGGVLTNATRDISIYGGEYIVDQDINIPPEYIINIWPGVKLKFASNVGMIIRGRCYIRGQPQAPVTMNLYQPTVPGLPIPVGAVNMSNATAVLHYLAANADTLLAPLSQPGAPPLNDALDTAALSAVGNDTEAMANLLRTRLRPVRLSDGPNRFAGRLEIYIPGKGWGTVCSRGWRLRSAMKVCEALGLALHPTDWHPDTMAFHEEGYPPSLADVKRSDRPRAPDSMPIHFSNVQCREYDLNLLSCHADRPSEFTCLHEHDVWMSCMPQTWAGVRFTASAKPGNLIENTVITGAGLLDEVEPLFKPALQIDYNHVLIRNLRLENSLTTGLMIVHGDPLLLNPVEKLTVKNSWGDGIVLKSPYIWLKDPILHNNKNGGAGVHYNPRFSDAESWDYVAWFEGQHVVNIPEQTEAFVPDDELLFLISKPAVYSPPDEQRTFVITLRQNNLRLIYLDVVDFNPKTSQERFILHDGTYPAARKYDLHRDDTFFPFLSSSGVIALEWHVNITQSGRLSVIVKAMEINIQPPAKFEEWYWPWYRPPATIRVQNGHISGNTYGMVMQHYNQPTGYRMDITRRRHYELIEVLNSDIADNDQSAINVQSLSKYDEFYYPDRDVMEKPARLSDIRYRIVASNITRNRGGGVVMEHSSVPFGNNLWAWEVADSVLDENSGGPTFFIEMPRVLGDWNSTKFMLNHSIEINGTQFVRNKWAEITLAGHHANLSFFDNIITENECRRGLVTISGTEKRTDFFNNNFTLNHCDFVVKFDLLSHVDQPEAASADFSYNTLVDNWPVTQHGRMAIDEHEDDSKKTYPVVQSQPGVVTGDRSRIYGFGHTPESGGNVSSLNYAPSLYLNRTKRDRIGGTHSESVGGFLDDDEDGYGLVVPRTYAVAILGVQNVTVNWNVFSNPTLRFEVVAGLRASAFEAAIDSRFNWWGYADQASIQGRIMDFDDWNTFSTAVYTPFLITPSNIGPSALSRETMKRPSFRADLPLRGKLFGLVQLTIDHSPYDVDSDITVMPGATLEIREGVELRFKPHIGILVLGLMRVVGTAQAKVKFLPAVDPTTPYRPPPQTVYPDYVKLRRKRSTLSEYPTALLRLNRSPTGSDSTVQSEGFVEFWNSTLNRWSVMCDYALSERTAGVICRQLGLDSVNARIRRTKHYDYIVYGYHTHFTRNYWRLAYQCAGDEDSLDLCVRQYNYRLVRCTKQEDYIYLRCGQRNLNAPAHYWGNIRFAAASPELGVGGSGVIEHAIIKGAGLLHGERAAAIEAIYHAPVLDHVDIRQCAWDAVHLVAPQSRIVITDSRFRDNLGHGVKVLAAQGAASSDQSSAFLPLVENVLPYSTYGLIDICTVEKTVLVGMRVLAFYKYSYVPADCVKDFKAQVRNKRLAIRFLQLNLYEDPFYANVIELYDGDIFMNTTLISAIRANATEAQRRKLYSTQPFQDRLGLHIHASGAAGQYGFIAEVFSMPAERQTRPPMSVIQRVKFERNQDGAVNYAAVGDMTPAARIEDCSVVDNGLGIYNLTSEPVIKFDLQNSEALSVTRNLILRNRGGLWVRVFTLGGGVPLDSANISNNYISRNTHGSALHVEGHHLEVVRVSSNWIAKNKGGRLMPNVNLTGATVNFTLNVVYNNSGSHNIQLAGPERIDRGTSLVYNHIYNNSAVGVPVNNSWREYRPTILCYSPRHSLHDNYFMNWENEYDIVTSNHTLFTVPTFKPAYYYTTTPLVSDAPLMTTIEPFLRVDASRNWWGQGQRYFVEARVWDWSKDWKLYPVLVDGFYTSNSSVLEGHCLPGWSLYDNRCYRYMGGVADYRTAQDLCRLERGWLADGLYRAQFLYALVSQRQTNYDARVQVWVRNREVTSGCIALQMNFLTELECDQLKPFICESDPYTPADYAWTPVIVAIVVGSLLFIALVILLVICFTKSRRRAEQRFYRRTSMRASVRTKTASMRTLDTNIDTNPNATGRYIRTPQGRPVGIVRPSSLTPGNSYQRAGTGDEEFFTWDSNKQSQQDVQSSYWPGTIGMTPVGGGSVGSRQQQHPDGTWGSNYQVADVDSWRGGSAAATGFPPPLQPSYAHHQQAQLVHRQPQPRHRVDMNDEDVALDTMPRFLPATDRPARPHSSSSTVSSVATTDVSYEPRPLETYM